MGLGDTLEVEKALGIKHATPPAPEVGTTTIEAMLAGILEASVMAAETGEKGREVVTITIERNIRTGYVTVIERVTGIGGGDMRTLHAAVESLYKRLAGKAQDEERRAGETLKRLGARK